MNTQKLFFIFVAVVSGILIAILISMTPPGADDLLFLLPAKGHEPSPCLWDMMIGEFPRIWQTQSGRLGNFLAMPFLYLMPKWIFGILSGVVTVLLIILSCRVAGTRPGSIVSWLLYATIVLAFPWYDYMTLVTYGINYLWAAAAVTSAIFFFLHIKAFSGMRLGAICLLLFAAGWIHEGFGAPLSAGLTLSLLLNRKKCDPKQIMAWLSACIGTCMTFLSPVFWQRSERESNFLLKFTYKELLMQIGPAILFFAIMVFLVIWVASRPSSRKKLLSSPPLLILTGAALGATAVFLKFFTGPRTGASVILYSALACGYILSSRTEKLKITITMQLAIGILIGGFSIVHLVYADILQARRSREYREITSLYEESEDGVFYYDLTYPKADLSLFKTSVRQFHEKVPKEFMRIYFKPDYKMVILPIALKGFEPGKAHRSEMTPGALIFNGWPVISDSIDTDSFTRIHVLTENGEYLPSRFRVDRFESPRHGHYKLITPHIKVLDQNLQIKDIALHDHSR